jgi:cell wall-associated NlpC family hydrolase
MAPRSTLVNYTPEQRRNIQLGIGATANDPAAIRRALLMAMGVESNYRHLDYGDRDSVGVLQQRPSQGWGPVGEPPQTDIQQFLSRARRNYQQGIRSPGELAQSVQRSAFPERYGQRSAEVNRLLGALGSGSTPAPPRTPLPSQTVPTQEPTGPLADPGLQRIFQSNNALLGLPEIDLSGFSAPRSQQPPESEPQQEGILVQRGVRKGSKRVQGAVALVQEYIGRDYVWGGESPETGFDCSGLLQYVWGKQGVQIPRVTYDQWKAGNPVGKRQLKPGDAVFFRAGERGPEHVGMMISRTQFVEAPGRGKQVRISKLAGRDDFLGGRRFSN